jgi:hypothetical protein
MKVININGRRQHSCRCGSWLDHWVKACGRPIPQHCAAISCMATPQLGAHVQMDNVRDSDWYIVPLCIKHSFSAMSLEVDDSTILVSAHPSDTCAKQMPIGDIGPRELPVAIATSALMHEQELARAKDLRNGGDTEMLRVYGKPKPRREEAPVLGSTY